MKKSWAEECYSSPMYQVTYKIKRCRMDLIRWHKLQDSNSAKRIQMLKLEMDAMKELEGQWDWERWNTLKNQLDLAYKEEEQFWSQKARIQWLEQGDKNTSYFHASVMQKRKCNRISYLDKEQGGRCNSKEEVDSRNFGILHRSLHN